jgi:hypothetical protein
MTIKEVMSDIFKMCTNGLSFYNRVCFDIQNCLKLKIDHFDNRINSEMNNITSIDYAFRDWNDDNDNMISRTCQEFPKHSMKYTSKVKLDNIPWGKKSKPIQIDPLVDENIFNLNSKPYETGVWYFAEYPQTDHNEFAGMRNYFRYLQTILGMDYRAGFYVNIYNKIRSLDFNNEKVDFPNESESE